MQRPESSRVMQNGAKKYKRVVREGELLAESVFRFKGQSAPIVIVCEIDFEEVGDQEARKLFVAMTRAQSQLHLIMTSAAEQALARQLERVPAR